MIESVDPGRPDLRADQFFDLRVEVALDRVWVILVEGYPGEWNELGAFSIEAGWGAEGARVLNRCDSTIAFDVGRGFAFRYLVNEVEGGPFGGLDVAQFSSDIQPCSPGFEEFDSNRRPGCCLFEYRKSRAYLTKG